MKQATNPQQKASSPWSIRWRIRMLLWECTWTLLCCWTPKPFNKWRLFWLRLFGAKISGIPFIHQRARIQIPWHLAIEDRACVGDRANLYSLGPITLKRGCIVAQEAYLCTGDHDLSQASKPLVTAPIIIEANAFIGARALILKGVSIGQNAIVGASSLVTKDVPADCCFAGNPAKSVSLTANDSLRDASSLSE